METGRGCGAGGWVGVRMYPSNCRGERGGGPGTGDAGVALTVAMVSFWPCWATVSVWSVSWGSTASSWNLLLPWCALVLVSTARGGRVGVGGFLVSRAWCRAARPLVNASVCDPWLCCLSHSRSSGFDVPGPEPWVCLHRRVAVAKGQSRRQCCRGSPPFTDCGSASQERQSPKRGVQSLLKSTFGRCLPRPALSSATVARSCSISDRRSTSAATAYTGAAWPWS